MLVTITRVINWSILFAFIACFSYQIVYLIAPYIKKEKTHKPLQMHRYAVLIAARNEENVLVDCLTAFAHRITRPNWWIFTSLRTTAPIPLLKLLMHTVPMYMNVLTGSRLEKDMP